MRRKVWSARDVSAASDTTALWNGGEGVVEESDVRAKEHIQQIGRTRHDLPLYRFRYKGGTENYAGVMAQDVLKVMPEAVSVGEDGFYRVNYGMLGISMVRLDGVVPDVGAGGEGVTVSDIRAKDRIEPIGTVSVAIVHRD